MYLFIVQYDNTMGETYLKYSSPDLDQSSSSVKSPNMIVTIINNLTAAAIVDRHCHH